MKFTSDDRQRLADEILETFHTCGPPFDKSKFPQEGEEYEETSAFLGKDWKELSVDDFEKYRGVFSFIPDEYLVFYLGAALWHTLVSNVRLVEALEAYFFMGSDVLGPDVQFRERALSAAFSRLNAEQRASLGSYFEWVKQGAYEDELEALNGLIERCGSA